jgi:aminoglycoside/choline kinase family phosphotransferase
VNSNTDKLSHLFQQWSGNKPDTIIALPPAGSDRRYWRLSKGNLSAIGAWNPVVEENEAFFSFTLHFHREGLRVPAIYGIDKAREAYLIEDLGDTSLLSLLERRNPDDPVPEEIVTVYKKSLEELVRFQVKAGKDLDYSYCYPHTSFDKRSIMWDLNYFKYYFLKLHATFHEGRIEDDFNALADYAGETESDYFMYRDFQARNIFIKNDQPYFIDYQGGRKGPLQYDVASLLFQVKADLPFELRQELLDYYISVVEKAVPINIKVFIKQYYGFVLIRLLQVLGAYGYRGLIEKKPHFLASIPYALKNLQWWLENNTLDINLPELTPTLIELTNLKQYKPDAVPVEKGKLTISLKSFSYKNGLPVDNSGNGGGFVFDCRALPNPGREEQYRAFNGKDNIIINYLKDIPEVISFLDDAQRIVNRSIDNYLSRGFEGLSISFGCTGGQHRSVYCTETLAERLRKKYPEVIIKVEHKMLKVED